MIFLISLKKNKMEFSIIVAYDSKTRGIGFQNKLPWKYCKEDMKHFKTMTEGNVVIMGLNTFRSISNPYSGEPLPNREKIVISKTVTDRQLGVRVETSLDNVLKNLPAGNKKIFVIGGGMLYKEAIVHPKCKYIYVTEFANLESNEYDTFFPPIPSNFKQISEKQGETPSLIFKTYENKFHPNGPEYVYLNLLDNVLKNGEIRDDRTGTGTVSLFGQRVEFSLHDDVLPLMTTKKTFFRGIVEELLFFLRGDHDNRKLQAKGIHIWDGNTSKEYLEKYGKKLEEHDLGFSYSISWKAAGSPLLGLEDSYIGKGIDQIAEIIYLLKTDPYSRRIILNSWNVSDLHKMSLHPCHVLYQFYVSNKGGEKWLSCMMFQRSADLFLGLPFNIASTSILTRILAQVCGMRPDRIIINIGDAHIYKTHIEQVKTQLERIPYYFPKLKINKNISTVEDTEQLQFEDFQLIDYHSWPTIKAEMAI